MSSLPAVIQVFLFGLVTALATGLGAIPFAFVRSVSPRIVAYTNALASGLMLGASFGLLAEGADYGRVATLIGANLGVLFVLAAGKLLGDHELEFGSVRGEDARKMTLIVLVMTVHSIAEGVAIGTAFAGGRSAPCSGREGPASPHVQAGASFPRSRSLCSRPRLSCSWVRSALCCRTGSVSPRGPWYSWSLSSCSPKRSRPVEGRRSRSW